MIEVRFGLKRRPFDKSIDSRKLYLWPGLEELQARLDGGASLEGDSPACSREQARRPGGDQRRDRARPRGLREL